MTNPAEKLPSSGDLDTHLRADALPSPLDYVTRRLRGLNLLTVSGTRFVLRSW